VSRFFREICDVRDVLELETSVANELSWDVVGCTLFDFVSLICGAIPATEAGREAVLADSIALAKLVAAGKRVAAVGACVCACVRLVCPRVAVRGALRLLLLLCVVLWNCVVALWAAVVATLLHSRGCCGWCTPVSRVRVGRGAGSVVVSLAVSRGLFSSRVCRTRADGARVC
jgi:hypothetical protein